VNNIRRARLNEREAPGKFVTTRPLNSGEAQVGRSAPGGTVGYAVV